MRKNVFTKKVNGNVEALLGNILKKQIKQLFLILCVQDLGAIVPLLELTTSLKSRAVSVGRLKNIRL